MSFATSICLSLLLSIFNQPYIFLKTFINIYINKQIDNKNNSENKNILFSVTTTATNPIVPKIIENTNITYITYVINILYIRFYSTNYIFINIIY